MNSPKCSREAAVARAARSGEWDQDLAAHASQCPICREVKQAAQWMQALLPDSGENCALPDPSILWSRARWQEELARKQAEAERARMALAWLEFLPLLVLGLGLAVWGIWNVQAVESVSAWAVSWLSPQIWIAAFYGASGSSITLETVVGVCFLAGIFVTAQFAAAG